MKFQKFLCAAFLVWIQSLQLAWAQVSLPHEEGARVSDGIVIKHGFRTSKTTMFPLPAGQWLVRHKESIQTQTSPPREGVRIVLDRVEAGQLEQVIWVDVYESNNIPWEAGASCATGLISAPRGTALSGGCFSLTGVGFLTDGFFSGRFGHVWSKLRTTWASESVVTQQRALALRGFSDARGGAVVYYSHWSPLTATPGDALASYLQRLRAGEFLSEPETRLSNWYRAYGKSIIDSVTGSAVASNPAAFPMAARNEMLGAASRVAAAAPAAPAREAADAAAKADRDRLSAELEAERSRRQEAEKVLLAREQERQAAEKKLQAELLKRQEDARVAQQKLEQERAERQRQEQASRSGQAEEESRVAAARAQEQQKAQEAAAQRDAKLAAELRELREQLQRIAAAPAAAAPTAAAASAAPAAQPATNTPAVPGSNARRMALVIGNDAYQSVSSLLNARSDARAMAKSLEAAGFKVTLRLDLTERAMKEALRSFRSEVQGGDEVVVFFAGHGVQLGAANYLLPIDIRGDSEEQVRDEAIPLQRILDDLNERKARFSLAIIDACRDNPFKTAGRAIGGRGLAPATAASGQMVIFSAGAGQQALDRLGEKDKEPNGLFTRVFLKEMSRPGVSIDRVVRNVRNEVVEKAKTIGHEQVPALYDQTMGDFFFLR